MIPPLPLSHFTAHLGGSAQLLWLTVLGNSVISISYLVISFQLYRAVRQKIIGVVMGQVIWILFSLFIMLCGLTHAMNVVVIWYPLYWCQAVITLMTAIVSIVTMVIFAPAVNTLIHIRGGNASHYFEAHRAIEMSSPGLDRLREIVKNDSQKAS